MIEDDPRRVRKIGATEDDLRFERACFVTFDTERDLLRVASKMFRLRMCGDWIANIVYPRTSRETRTALLAFHQAGVWTRGKFWRTGRRLRLLIRELNSGLKHGTDGRIISPAVPERIFRPPQGAAISGATFEGMRFALVRNAVVETRAGYATVIGIDCTDGSWSRIRVPEFAELVGTTERHDPSEKRTGLKEYYDPFEGPETEAAVRPETGSYGFCETGVWCPSTRRSHPHWLKEDGWSL